LARSPATRPQVCRMQRDRRWLGSGRCSAGTRAHNRPRTGQGSRWTHLPEVRTHGLALDIDLPVQRRTATRRRTGAKRLCRCRHSDDIDGSLQLRIDRPQMLLRQPAAARSARTNLTQDNDHRREPPKVEPEKTRKFNWPSAVTRQKFEWELKNARLSY
jgi:hypothetical protein